MWQEAMEKRRSADRFNQPLHLLSAEHFLLERYCPIPNAFSMVYMHRLPSPPTSNKSPRSPANSMSRFVKQLIENNTNVSRRLSLFQGTSSFFVADQKTSASVGWLRYLHSAKTLSLQAGCKLPCRLIALTYKIMEKKTIQPVFC